MTCFSHTGAPQRMCHFCNAIYCDADDHGHTKETCTAFLEARFSAATANARYWVELLERRRKE